jgi:hypothetical protein
MNTSEIKLDVEVTQADADPEQLDQLARQG